VIAGRAPAAGRQPARVAIVGGGWAGLACAVRATEAGHAVTVFEATRTWGGRARRVETNEGTLDNGQHILIGAYSASLALMRTVGVDPDAALLRMPLTLRFADGGGVALPAAPPSLALLAGIWGARGWDWRDKSTLLAWALRWRVAGFRCAPQATVADLARSLTPRVRAQLIEPLCVSALNTPLDRASGEVFLRVLRDALLGGRGSADLLLPRVDLGAMLPDAAAAWLAGHGAVLEPGLRVRSLARVAARWQIDGNAFDAVVLATPPWETARLVREASGMEERAAADWAACAQTLQYEGIATVYADGAPALPGGLPLMALHGSGAAPAQFVFDRGMLGGPRGLAAFVISATDAPAATLQRQVLAQAREQLGWEGLRPVRTIVERRATFACVPGLRRPWAGIAPGLWACGDYVDGPYPATLEGAARCADQVAAALATSPRPGAATPSP